jgi:hypothetical protein
MHTKQFAVFSEIIPLFLTVKNINNLLFNSFRVFSFSGEDKDDKEGVQWKIQAACSTYYCCCTVFWGVLVVKEACVQASQTRQRKPRCRRRSWRWNKTKRKNIQDKKEFEADLLQFFIHAYV